MTDTRLSASQSRALAKIVSLARAHSLSAPAITEALSKAKAAENDNTAPAPGGGFLTALLGYLGGALIVSGLFIYASMAWDDLGSFPRVLLSLGSGLVAFYVGCLMQKEGQTQKASMPLWVLSALLVPTGLSVFLNEYMPGDDPILGGVVIFGSCTALYGTAFAQFRKTSLAFLTAVFGLMFIGTFYEYAGLNTPIMWLGTGISILIAGIETHRSRYAESSFFPLIVGATAITASSYYYLGNTSAEGAMAALLLGLIALGYKLQSRSLITLSTIFFAVLICKYNMFGWGYREDTALKLTALITGLSMMAMAEWLKTQSRLVPLWNFFGSSLFFSAAMGILYLSAFDIIFPILPAAMLMVSMKLHSRALLLSSILALLSFISYYTAEYFANTVGWPIALMLMGFAMIGLCTMALRMNNRIKAGTAAQA
ncbi:MAG TPA: hypothetical protein PLO23_06040 [Alphaproteobacteria bacterium]|nr:hypothetical protein [Alphaproteobacteria bacterium]